MVKRPVPTTPQPAILTREAIENGIKQLGRRQDDVQKFDSNAITYENADAMTTPLKHSIDDTMVQVFGVETVEYNRYRGAAHFSWPIYMGHRAPLHEIQASLEECKLRSLSILAGAIKSLEERLADLPESVPVQTNSPGVRVSKGRKIFVVHGHDEAAKQIVARFLERADFEPIILHEQPNGGKTLIEKFEAHSDVGFAIVLMTPDDHGAEAGKPTQPRARQNVILELGYFVGKLGRPKVMVLMKEHLELPADIHGVVYEPLDSADGWKIKLAKELKAAGYELDWDKIMSS